MKYLMSVIDDTAGAATGDEGAAIDVFNDQLVADGHWVFAGGLGSTDNATVIDNRHGKAVFTDGPFVETKEQLGGFWVIKADDLDEALDWARKATVACLAPVEVRPFEDEPGPTD